MRLRELIEESGGRRFLLSVGCALVTTILTAFEKIDGATYAAVILGTVGAYIAGNTVQKVKGAPDGRVTGEISSRG